MTSEMTKNLLIPLIISIVGTGGLIITLLNLWANRNRCKSKTDIANMNVEAAIELQKIAMENYTTTNEKLNVAMSQMETTKQILIDVQIDLDKAKAYIRVLEDLLKRNNINIPKNVKKRYGFDIEETQMSIDDTIGVIDNINDKFNTKG